MQSIYRLNAEELNADFLEGLKLTFKDRQIEIIVSVVDETEYLLQSPENRERLMKAIDNIENSENLVTVSLDE